MKRNTDDIELLNRVKRDDKAALDILFKKYYRSLCLFSRQYLKNTELSEEAVSDIFLNIWLKRREIKITTSLRSYLYSAVKNQSLNYLKLNKYSFENLETVDNEGIISDIGAEDSISFNEINGEIEAILNKLPDKRGLVFRMSRIDGLSYNEIADELSISVNTVENHMAKAIKFIIGQYSKIKESIL